MSRARWSVVLSLLGFLATGCADISDSQLLSPGETEVQPPRSFASIDGLGEVARAIALALADEAIRVDVRDAMRASQVTEHKLVLQDYIVTPRGERLLEAAAAAVGSSPAALTDLVSKLPRLDFYVPVREHRLTWHATGDIVVVATANSDSPQIDGYTPRGGAVSVDLTRAAPTRVLVALHPEERKSRRIHPQPESPGLVIQDANDGELSGSLEWIGPDGRRTLVELAELCEPDALDCGGGGGGGGGGSAPSDTMKLYRQIAYFGDGVGSAELEYTTVHPTQGSKMVRYEGVDKNFWYTRNSILWFTTLSSGSATVSVVETDAFSDDYWGDGVIHTTDNGVAISVIGWCGDMYKDSYGGWQLYCANYFEPLVTTRVIYSW